MLSEPLEFRACKERSTENDLLRSVLSDAENLVGTCGVPGVPYVVESAVTPAVPVIKTTTQQINLCGSVWQ